MKQETYNQIINLITQKQKGLTTTELANEIELSRSTASTYLNELLQKGRIEKSGNKPVYWKIKRKQHVKNEVFSQFIGSEGSIKTEIEKCIAATLYPPRGLPLLIHGKSGVGKSYLAQVIFDYLKQENMAGTRAFFVFNCADYANNPELLSSLLFGHREGAFTGAKGARKGLLAQANEGMLFLDEIHRLSNENQEKLFQFMDTGKFRPLGEDQVTESSNVRLLFATTENPEEVLLPTFYRRISVIINLPSFHERPIFERAHLLKSLFQREANRIDRELRIGHAAFYDLLEKRFAGNVGSILNKIQMYCADALRRQPNQAYLFIGEASEKEEAIIIIGKTTTSTGFEKEDISDAFNALFQQETDGDLSQLKDDIQQLDDLYLKNHVSLNQDPIAARFFQLVQRKNEEVLDHVTLTYDALQLVLRIFQSLEKLPETAILDQLDQQLLLEYPRTRSLCGYLIIELPEEARLFVKTLMAILLIGSVSEDIQYQSLLVAHGNTTATSIQGVANKLCGEYIFDAINMPLSSSIQDVIQEVQHWLDERNTQEGVIMLVDMGSLTHLYKSLKPNILGELLVVNNLTTSYALDIGQQLVNGNRFYDIAKNAEESFQPQIQYFEGFSVEKNIIISSISGIDLSKKIKKICEKYFYPDIKQITLNFTELTRTLDKAMVEENYLKETSLILTTSYFDYTTDIPMLNLLDVVDQDAEKQVTRVLRNLMHPKNIPNLIQDFIYFFSKEGLSEKLEFLNPDIIIKQVEDITETCERRFDLKLHAKVKFNLTMHLAVMVERTILGGADYPLPENVHELRINNKMFYQNIKSILHTLEKFYRIEISDWEVYVLYEILTA